MLMLLLRLLLLPMKMPDVDAADSELEDLSADRATVLDALDLVVLTGGHLPEKPQELDATRDPGQHPAGNRSRDADVDSSPSQSHTEAQGGTPSPSDTRVKRLNSKAD
jgi:hypothetical protein